MSSRKKLKMVASNMEVAVGEAAGAGQARAGFPAAPAAPDPEVRAYRVIKFLWCVFIVALAAAMMSPSEWATSSAVVAAETNPAAGFERRNPPGSDATPNSAVEELIAVHRNWGGCSCGCFTLKFALGATRVSGLTRWPAHEDRP